MIALLFTVTLYLILGLCYAFAVSRHPAARGFGLLDYACAVALWPYLLFVGWQRMGKSLRVFAAGLLALLITAACAPAFADDPGTAVAVSAPALSAPGPVIQAPGAMPAIPALPADRSANGWIFWVLASVIPFLGWCVSEIQAISPGLKSNGILHWFLITTGAIKADPEKQTVTLDLAEFRQLVQNHAPQPAPEVAAPAES